MKRRWVQHKAEDAKVHGGGWIIAEEREWEGEFVYDTGVFAGLASDFTQIGEYVLDHDEITALRQQVEELTKERGLLRQAVVRYCDHSRMGTVEPMSVQQVIDDAFQYDGGCRRAKIMEEMIAEDAHLLEIDNE